MTTQSKENMFIALRVFFDAISVPLIITFGYSLKFKVGWVFQKIFSLQVGEIYDHAQIEPYFQSIIVLIVIWTVAFYFSGVYKTYSGIMPEVDEAVKVAKGIMFASLIIVAMTFFYTIIPGSRFVVVYSAIFSFFWLMWGRLVLNRVERKLLQKGKGARPTLVIGAGAVGQDVVEKMFLHPFLRLYYIGHIDSEYPEKVHFHLKDKLSLLGDIQDIQKVVLEQHIKVVFLTRQLKKKQLDELILFCESQNVELYHLVESSDFMTGTIEVTNFDGLPFITHRSIPEYHYGLKGKRIFDIVLSLLSMVLLIPVFLAIAILIKVVSPKGPVLYSQERVGQHDKTFKMLKFRTMIPDAEKSGPVMVNESGDDRYIPFGGFLRRTSLDELPQLINILKGEMSIVGPRPERPYFVDLFKESIPHYSLRHRLPVGLTGWAQVNGRSVLTRRPEHKVKYDLYYTKNWSFIFDIKIIVKTLFVVLKSEEAY
jgi:exopolysaccharide biosynthesis polyprenyl glycosylphosphotransferase